MSSEKEEVKLPEGAEFTLVIPLDRGGKRKATFHLKEIDEDIFLGAKKMIDQGKHFEAVRMVIKALWVGGDSIDLLSKNFVAINAASKAVVELITPLDADLKKN